MAISIFTPKGAKFFSLFDHMAETIAQMYQQYIRFLQVKDNASLFAELQQLKEMRYTSHDTAHRIYTELGKNFITPLDREDIYALATALDGVSDYIYALARQRVNYNLIDLPEYSFVISQRLSLALNELNGIIHNLSHKNKDEKLAAPCKQMKMVLDSCFRLADTAKSEILNKENEVLDVIKLLDHFEYTTTLIRKCKDAGVTIDNIIIKYS